MTALLDPPPVEVAGVAHPVHLEEEVAARPAKGDFIRLPGRLHRYLTNITGYPAGALPLLILTIVFFLDEFDTAAFGVLGPTIQREFDLSDAEYQSIVGGNLAFSLFLSVPISYLGDRFPRRWLVLTGGLMAGIFSMATGLAGAIAFLVVFRLGNGIGVLMNGPVHNSMLSDYSMPANRGRTFGWHQNGQYAGAIAGPALAGGLSAMFGWRWAFIPLAIPLILVTILAMKLREPLRGETDDETSARALAGTGHVPFQEAGRVLLGVPTLKRQYAAFAFFGAGILPLSVLYSQFYEREFGVDDFGRGLIFALQASFSLIGVTYSGRATPRWFAKGMGEPLKRTGFLFLFIAVGLLALSAVPDNLLPLAIAIGCLNSAIGGLFYPPFLATQALVSPARVRTLSFGFGTIFLAGGFLLLWLPFAGNVSDDHGVRWGIAVLTPYLVIGGIILATASRSVQRDAEQALANMALTLRLAEEREQAGEGGSLLVCRGLEVGYGQTQILFGVDFDVHEGEIVALLGTNGAGKSTLLKSIVGSLPPMAGATFFDGREITRMNAPNVAQLGIALVPGGKGVFPTLTVEENFELASWILRKDQAFIAEAREQALDYFPVLRERFDQKAGNLSGGEQQMLLIGMALLAKPRVLIIDELSLGLAPLIVERLLEVVRKINADGVTMVLVEQSVNVALTLADRAVFMEKGEVRFDGPTGDLLNRPDILRSVFLEGASASSDGELDMPTPEAGVVYEKVPFEIPKDRKGREKPPILQVRDLSVAFGGIRAVNNVDLDVHAGQIIGLIGPNGAGKTTIFDLISGFLVPTSGRIVLDGVDTTAFTADARARMGLGRSFQDAKLFPSMTVKETIAIALERHLKVKDPLAATLGSPATRATEREVSAKVDRLIDLMRLSAFANKFVGELSTGSRRIVDLACTLAHEPSVLLLDEPSSGIAQRETEALGPLLLDIRDETGAGLIVIEHDMPLITGISDQLVALELGRVMLKGDPQDVINDPHVVASYLGTTEATINRSGDAGLSLAHEQVAAAAGAKAAGNGAAPADGAVGDGVGNGAPKRARTPRQARPKEPSGS